MQVNTRRQGPVTYRTDTPLLASVLREPSASGAGTTGSSRALNGVNLRSGCWNWQSRRCGRVRSNYSWRGRRKVTACRCRGKESWLYGQPFLQTARSTHPNQARSTQTQAPKHTLSPGSLIPDNSSLLNAARHALSNPSQSPATSTSDAIDRRSTHQQSDTARRPRHPRCTAHAHAPLMVAPAPRLEIVPIPKLERIVLVVIVLVDRHDPRDVKSLLSRTGIIGRRRGRLDRRGAGGLDRAGE
jgi:hypothetical protein